MHRVVVCLPRFIHSLLDVPRQLRLNHMRAGELTSLFVPTRGARTWRVHSRVLSSKAGGFLASLGDVEVSNSLLRLTGRGNVYGELVDLGSTPAALIVMRYKSAMTEVDLLETSAR